MFVPRALIPLLGFTGLIALVGLHPASAANEQAFQETASEILRGLDRASTDHLPAINGYGAPTIGIRPFIKREVPTDIETANGYNRSLLVALQKKSNGRYRFVSRETTNKLIEDIRTSGLSEDEMDQRIAELRANSRADILISGNLSQEDHGTSISYQALSAETAHVFVSTQPRMLDNSSAPDVSSRASFLNGYSDIVAEAENLLDEMGYDPGPIDGHMTRETREALRNYQLDSALPVNGRMTRRVVDNMRRDMR